MRRSIVAGEPELHRWCPVCQLPSRVCVPLHLDAVGAEPAAVLEICPGCGTGHDRPSVTVTASPRGRPRPLVAVAHAVNRRLAQRAGRQPLGCAHAACPWPGRYRLLHEMPDDDGTWRYLFCTKRHRTRWAVDNLIRL